MTEKMMTHFKKDPVFSIALLLALVSMLLVPPSPDYLHYIDINVLGILFCLMCVVAGFQSCGLLQAVSGRLLRLAHSLRGISFLLVSLCFFSAMLLTNDVALIAFVPLTLLTLQTVPPRQLAYLVVLETMAANLGSMLTPVGNPQNLYLYSYYQMELSSFLTVVAPVCALSFLLLVGLVLLGKSQRIETKSEPRVTLEPRRLWVYAALFVLCLFTVLRVVDARICTLVTLVTVLLCDRSLLRRVDYLLLGTFCAFFVLVGNLGSLAVVRDWVAALMQGQELLVTVLASQVISNVPAAIMLSRFTDNASALLLGSNLGGLGTLVASLASLISYKFYVKSPKAQPVFYLGLFTLLNVSVLVVLSIFVVWTS